MDRKGAPWLAESLNFWPIRSTRPIRTGVLWQRMGHDNATAERLRRCFDRLGGDYPEWTPDLLAELLRFQQETSASQRAGRLIGSEVDAALDDPRWL